MAFGSMLYSFFLMPIQLIFEVVFSYAYRLTGEKPGLAIIALSLAINLLVLPLYRRADTMQEEERKTEAKLHKGVAHIKKVFHGSERTMMLQTYYRQNNYSPLYVLRSAVSLFLEIPFFIAAYRFLSGLSLLQGVSFGPIADLGQPDRLISIGGLSINFLPILMTIVNVISTIIFTKGYPLKTKIQLYGMAAFFLVFLYGSPSGLVFYWTLNNVFSLVKTIFYKMKNPAKVLKALSLLVGICLIAYGVWSYMGNALINRLALFVGAGVVMCVPFIWGLIRSKKNETRSLIKSQPNKKLFLGSTIFLAVLTGLLIPSSVVSASPQEFIIAGEYLHPFWYIVNAFLIASGLFILWFGVFYWLFSPKVKVIFERVTVAACALGVVNYLFFGKNVGTLSSELVYTDNEVIYSGRQMLINTAVLAVAAVVIVLIANKKAKLALGAVAAATLTMVCMSGINSFGVFQSVAKVDMKALSVSSSRPDLSLSKNGRNVVVLMLDRAMGEYIPYIMYEHPELEEKFGGFTYYSNTVSFGGHTNFGAPALFGGYEYTPVEMNKRDTEPLSAKHNEALKVMPVLFDEAGYDVTVCDAPYAGYKEIPDMSIYDSYPDIKTFVAQEYSFDATQKQQLINGRYRNFFCFSIVKTLPVALQPTLYDTGRYHQLDTAMITFGKAYEVLKNLSGITSVSDNNTGSFIMMNNDTTHNLAGFEDDQYLKPTTNIKGHGKQDIELNGTVLKLKDQNQIGSYQSNAAALTRLSEWFDYLREQGVYDNTRIIIVSDHGFATKQIEGFLFDDTVNAEKLDQRYGDMEFYFPLLLVKDFDSREKLTTSDEFMTNADVPTMAVDGLIENAVNPFTGKAIDNSEKTAHDQFVIASKNYFINQNNGNTFAPARWYRVRDSIWNMENWELVAEKDVLR